MVDVLGDTFAEPDELFSITLSTSTKSCGASERRSAQRAGGDSMSYMYDTKIKLVRQTSDELLHYWTWLILVQRDLQSIEEPQ
jgi:hypothetical protein